MSQNMHFYKHSLGPGLHIRKTSIFSKTLRDSTTYWAERVCLRWMCDYQKADIQPHVLQ